MRQKIHALVVGLAMCLLAACTPAAAEPPAVIITPTPLAVEPFAGRYVVMADTAVLRTGPGIEFDEAGTLSAGTVIELDGISPAGDWFRMDNGRWIAAGFVAPATAVPPDADRPPDGPETTESASPTVTATGVPTASSSQANPPCQSAPITWVPYVVQQGDSLSNIAQRTGTTVAYLQQFNCLSSDVVVVGQALSVPPSPATQAQATNAPPPAASATPVSGSRTGQPAATTAPTVPPAPSQPPAQPRPPATPVPTTTALPTATSSPLPPDPPIPTTTGVPREVTNTPLVPPAPTVGPIAP